MNDENSHLTNKKWSVFLFSNLASPNILTGCLRRKMFNTVGIKNERLRNVNLTIRKT
jgi:hypothetical protein